MLEQVIAENTSAIRELIAALAAGAPVPADKPKIEKAKPAPEPEPTPVPVPDNAPVSYEAAAEAITKLARGGKRPEAVAILAEFNVAKVSQATPDQYGPILAAANAALGL